MEKGETTDLRLPVLAPEAAYVGVSLFLPRKLIAEGPIRRALTFGIDPSEPPRELVVDHPFHLEVPRNYASKEELQELGIPLVDMRPKQFKKIPLHVPESFSLRHHQKPAWASMLERLDARADMILRLGTGRGKTVMGWRAAAELQEPTLVLSAQEAHLKNWETELRNIFNFRGEVGWIIRKRMEHDRDVVFATIQTLIRRVESGDLPENFSRHFGLVIFDEAHHMAASWFCKAADLVTGVRISLTATLNRKDRCEGVVLAHMGSVVYDDPEEDALEPTVHVHDTGVRIPADHPELLDRLGMPNISKMRSYLGQLHERNACVVETVKRRLAENRKVYLLSHSRDQVYALGKLLMANGIQPGIITGDDKDADRRLQQLNGYDVVVATVAVGKEAYNRPEFSSLILASPMSVDSYAPTEFVQSVGRVIRPLKDKPDPTVDLFYDPGVGPSAGMLQTVLRWCRRCEWSIKGDPWQTKATKRFAHTS